MRTPVVSRRSSRKRKLDVDQLKELQEKDKVEGFELFSQDHAPSEFNFKILQESVQYYRLSFDSKTSFQSVDKCISIEKEFDIKLTFQGFWKLLPHWFRVGHNCTVSRLGMPEGFISHIKN